MKLMAINENITEGKKGECDICVKEAEDIGIALKNEEASTAEYIKTSWVSEKSINLIEEIRKLSDEEFDLFLGHLACRSNKNMLRFAEWAVKQRGV